MSVITSSDIIRAIVAGVLCPALLYAGDRALVFHASLFRSMFSGDKLESMSSKRAKALINGPKIAALVLTTVAFCATVLTNGRLVVPIAITIAAFLAFMGLSLFETLRASKDLREGR